MSDRFDDAVAAFRDQQDRTRGDAAIGRRELLRTVQRRESRRKLSLAAAVVLALVGTNSTTWAWSTGRLEPIAQLFDAGHELDAAPASDDRTAHTARHDRPAVTRRAVQERAPAEAAVAAEAEPSAAERPTSASSPAASRVPPIARHREAPQPAAMDTANEADTTAEPAAVDPDALAAALAELEGTDAPRDDADRRAFADAHGVHFGGGAPGAALAAWDRYLARFPAGRFVPEARFNRAVTLLRLRRDDEARAALRPFADGAYDGVRAREASALLDAMEQGTLRR